jgi:hypothetical protein
MGEEGGHDYYPGIYLEGLRKAKETPLRIMRFKLGTSRKQIRSLPLVQTFSLQSVRCEDIN